MPVPSKKTQEFFIPLEKIRNEVINIPEIPEISIHIPVSHLILLRLFSSNSDELLGSE